MTKHQRQKLNDYDELLASIAQKQAQLDRRRREIETLRDSLLSELGGEQAQIGRAA